MTDSIVQTEKNRLSDFDQHANERCVDRSRSGRASGSWQSENTDEVNGESAGARFDFCWNPMVTG